MMRHRLFQIAILVSTGLAASEGTARAQGPGCGPAGCPGAGSYGGGCGGGKCGYPRYTSLAGYFGAGCGQLPAYQAAPWYLYWPYDGHFLTPAPVTGAFYGPPTPGNFPVNPYFPGPGYGYGSGYGPIPGGAAPVSAPYGYGQQYAPMPGYAPPGPATLPSAPIPPAGIPPRQ